MNKNTQHSLYVVYNSRPIVIFGGYGDAIIPSGFRLAPYPLASDEVKFVGNYLECSFIYNALLDYNPN